MGGRGKPDQGDKIRQKQHWCNESYFRRVTQKYNKFYPLNQIKISCMSCSICGYTAPVSCERDNL